LGWLVLAVTLTGCGSAEFSSRFNADGSARHTLQISIPTTELSDVEAARIVAFFDQIDRQSADAGLDVVRFQSGPEIIFRVTRSVPDSSDVGAALNGLLNASGLNPSPGIIAPFAGTFRQESRAVGGRYYALALTVNGDVLFETISEERGLGSDPSWPAGLRDDVEVQYLASLPGRITEMNGEQLDDGSVVWNIPLSGTTAMSARSTLSGGFATTGFVIVAIAVAVVIAGAALLVALAINRWPLPRRLRAAEVEAEQGQQNVAGAWLSRRAQQIAALLERSDSGQSNALSSESEASDGVDAEGDGPPAGVRGGRAGSEAPGPRLET
jgi:hypothetical protein